jgi:hypothetical protein
VLGVSVTASDEQLQLFGRFRESPLPFEQLERFAVTAALEEVAQLRVDRRGQLVFELLDPFGDGLQAFGVSGGIAAAFFVSDDGEALPECVGEVG